MTAYERSEDRIVSSRWCFLGLFPLAASLFYVLKQEYLMVKNTSLEVESELSRTLEPCLIPITHKKLV